MATPSRITTAAELEQMTPAERDAHFAASIMRDPADLPTALVNKARERLTQRITAKR